MTPGISISDYIMDSVRKNRSVLITRWVDLCMLRFLLHASPTHSAGSFLLGIVVINYHLPPNPGFACPPWASHFLNLADWRNRWPLTEFLVYLSLASFSELAYYWEDPRCYSHLSREIFFGCQIHAQYRSFIFCRRNQWCIDWEGLGRRRTETMQGYPNQAFNNPSHRLPGVWTWCLQHNVLSGSVQYINNRVFIFFPPQKTFIITKRICYDNGRCCTIKYCFKKWPLQKVIIPVVWEVAYPASRGYIFAVWAGMRKVASAEDRSIFYRECAKFVTRFASKINRHFLSSNGASFAGIRKLPQLWSATQESRNVLNRLRTGKKPFFQLFVQISGRIWAVVGRGYFSNDNSHRGNVASARRVEVALVVWGKKNINMYIHNTAQWSMAVILSINQISSF